MVNLIGCKVALCALVRFLPGVNEGVGLQIISSPKWFVALRTNVPLVSTVGLLVTIKATSICKVLGTQVARLPIYHPSISTFCFLLTLFPDDYCGNSRKIIYNIWSLSLSPIPDNCYGHHGRCPCKNILSGVKFSRLNTKTAHILLFRDIFQCFGVFLV